MISDKLYLEAEQSGITVLCGAELSLTKSVSVELPDGEMFIGIDDSVMRSRAEERVHLAHEIGHCVTGAMYNVHCPIIPRQRCERIADAYAIKKLVDEPFFFRRGGGDCRELIGEMMREAGTRLPGFREKTSGYFVSLLINLGRYAAGVGDEPMPENRTIKVGKIDLRAMLDTYFFGLVDFATPERIIDDLHITRRHLSRLMRQYYGMSYVDKINELRCEHAKELLRDNVVPISGVWSEVGYTSQQYFSRVFKKHVGMTSSEYRAKFAKKQ